MSALPNWSGPLGEQGQGQGLVLLFSSVGVRVWLTGIETTTGASAMVGNQYGGCL